jgi:hypothetical protein
MSSTRGFAIHLIRVDYSAMKRILGIALAGAAAVVALTWVLQRVMPPPYSGYLALSIVGLTVTTILKRRPAERAARWFRRYYRARARGDERMARERLLAPLRRRPQLRAEIEAAWRGTSEEERVLAGVRALLAACGQSIEPPAFRAAYDGVRDRFPVTSWSMLPDAFVREVRRCLEERDQHHLDALTDKYRLFQQRFFRRPSSLGADPGSGVQEFARLLASLGNHIAKDEPGDAERAYRLSLRLHPDENLAHAGLALLFERTGRNRDALIEAHEGLQVLDTFAARASERPPSTEDIYPFTSPKSLREALLRVTGGSPSSS